MKYSFLWKMCSIAIKKSFRALNEKSLKLEHIFQICLIEKQYAASGLCSIISHL